MGPLYGVVLVLHVLSAVVGFGTLAATGSYARSGRRAAPGSISASVRRYFAPGKSLPGLALFLVPVLGFVLLFLGHWRDATAPYPWVGLALWLVAAGLATGVAWPAERAARRLLSSVPRVAVASSPERVALERAFRACERAALVSTCCFAVAVYFMAVQPG